MTDLTIPAQAPPAPYWSSSDGRLVLHRGDALAVLHALPDESVDAVFADPPYSSGGAFRSDRVATSTIGKYLGGSDYAAANADRLGDIAGDSRDQRAYGYWCALWLAECLRVTRSGGVCMLWADWRQLPTTTDALQAGGWIWRGIVPWGKPDARPQVGRFRNACEYVVWGSAGPMPPAPGAPCLPGFYEAVAPRNRVHPTQKPLGVIRALVRIAPPDGIVLDPFMGSGTTGLAASMEGRRFVGVEQVEHYLQIAVDRLGMAAAADPGAPALFDLDDGGGH
jgi:site-specific DNA-methyltransferase (adenine-specific)